MATRDLTFRLFGEDSTASSSLRRLAENADRASSRMSSSMGRSHAAFGGLVGGLVGGVTSGITSMIGSAISDVGSMLTQVGGMIASTVVDYNSTLENANIGFTTMLGSGKKSKAFLDDLQNFAKSTPFEFKDLVTNAQQLMGMGIAANDVIPDLTALGDSVAAMGGSADQVNSVTLAFGQMAAKGTLDMGNIQQLAQGGVPSALKVLASSYHVTTGKMIEMISSGKVMSSDALPRLVKGIEKGTKATSALGGMMDKQSATFTGALSNIQDGLTQTVSKAFKPFFDAASKGMGHFATALSGKPAAKFTKDVTKTLQPFAKQIEKWFKGIDIGKIFATAGKGMKTIFKGIDPKDLGKGLQDFGKMAGDIFADIVRVAPKVIKMVKELAPGVMATVKQLVDFVGWIADAIDWLIKLDPQFRKAGDDFKGFFVDAWGTVVNLFTGAVGVFRHGWDEIVGFFTQAGTNIQKVGQQMVDFFTGIPAAMTQVGTDMVNGLVGGLRDAWGGLTSTLHDLAMLLPEPVRNALGIHSPSRVFHTIGRQVGQGLHNGLLGSKDQILSASNKLADAITSAFKNKDISKSAETVALAALKSGTRQLEEIAKRRAAVAVRLQAAKDKLKDAFSTRSDYAAGVKSSTFGAGDVTQFGAAGDMVQHLQELVAHTKTFRNVLKSLVKKGIDQGTYNQLVQAGVEGGGLAAAQSLLANPVDLKQVVSLQRQLASAAGGLGTDTAGHRYASAIDTDKSHVNALTGIDRALGRQQRSVAASTVRRVEHAVHVHVNVSGTIVGSQTALAKEVVAAIRAATRSGAISKDALKV